MFMPLLDLRLVVVDSLNGTAEDEQLATAQAWVDILELEAGRLTENPSAWLPISADLDTQLRRRRGKDWGRVLGQAEARLSLIEADQAVAELIRAQLSDSGSPPTYA